MNGNYEELLEENEYLKKTVAAYKARESEIALAEENAKKKAAEITLAAEKIFNLEADRLRLFRLSWDAKFSTLKGDREKLEKLNALAVKIDDVVSGRGIYGDMTYGEKTEEMRRLVGEDGKLISRSDVYIGEGEDGFSLDEVLNPKETQDLASLLKEMGVTEE